MSRRITVKGQPVTSPVSAAPSSAGPSPMIAPSPTKDSTSARPTPAPMLAQRLARYTCTSATTTPRTTEPRKTGRTGSPVAKDSDTATVTAITKAHKAPRAGAVTYPYRNTLTALPPD